MIVCIIAGGALILGIWFIRSNTVEGWEDETGFHFGHNPKDDV